MRGKVRVPERGRFLVIDGKVYRIRDQWIERRDTDQVRWGVVAERKEAQ